MQAVRARAEVLHGHMPHSWSYEKDLHVCRSLGALESQVTRNRTYWIRTVSLWHKKALKPSLPLEVERINKAFETKVVY